MPVPVNAEVLWWQVNLHCEEQSDGHVQPGTRNFLVWAQGMWSSGWPRSIGALIIRIGLPLKGSLKGPWQPHGDFAPYTYNVTPSVQ